TAVLTRILPAARFPSPADDDNALRHAVLYQHASHCIGPPQRETLVVAGRARRIGIPGDLNRCGRSCSISVGRESQDLSPLWTQYRTVIVEVDSIGRRRGRRRRWWRVRGDRRR